MGNKLFVGGLKWEATEDDLREFFAEAGEITDAVVLHDRDTGRSRGFGFVTYATDEEAKAAVEKYNEADFMGRKLTVNEARQREERSGGGGGGGGGGGWRNERRLHRRSLHRRRLRQGLPGSRGAGRQRGAVKDTSAAFAAWR